MNRYQLIKHILWIAVSLGISAILLHGLNVYLIAATVLLAIYTGYHLSSEREAVNRKQIVDQPEFEANLRTGLIKRKLSRRELAPLTVALGAFVLILAYASASGDKPRKLERLVFAFFGREGVTFAWVALIQGSERLLGSQERKR